MADFDAAARALRDSLAPLKAYCDSQLARPDLSAYAFRHVGELTAALDAAREFYEAAKGAQERQAAPPQSTSAILAARRCLATTAYLLNHPPEVRRNLAEYAQAFALYSHPHLPFPIITSLPC